MCHQSEECRQILNRTGVEVWAVQGWSACDSRSGAGVRCHPHKFDSSFERLPSPEYSTVGSEHVHNYSRFSFVRGGMGWAH